MNPQKNQGAEDSALLRDIQAEVSSESAPMLQFILRHAGVIAGFLILFVLVLAGTGIWRWYSTSRIEEARQSLTSILLERQGEDQVRALADLAGKVPADVRFSAYMALGQSAMRNGDAAGASDAFAKAAKEYKGALNLAAVMEQANALFAANKNAEALALLQQTLSSLPGEIHTIQLRQMAAEAAEANGQPEEAARIYLVLSREAQGMNSAYFRERAKALAPQIVKQEGSQTPAVPEITPGTASEKPQSSAR